MASLVPWLPRIVEATAEDVARFGPNAARVRSLLDYIPTMSDEAARISGWAHTSIPEVAQDSASKEVYELAKSTPRRAAADLALRTAREYATDTGLGDSAGWGDAYGAVVDAFVPEVLSDVLAPDTYRILADPFAAGRAVDVLSTRPRLQGTRFMDIAQQAAERGGITRPRDVVAVSRIAQSPEDVIDIALTLIADGMPVEEAMRTSRMLAQ